MKDDKGTYVGKEELMNHEVSFGSFLDNTYALVRSYVEGTSIADVGCGTGVFAEKFYRDGFTVSCFELDHELAEIAKQKNLPVTECDVLSTEFISRYTNTFDSVYSLDVLEHIENEDGFLQSMLAVLKPNGVAVIKVPAHMFLYADLDRRIGHYRRYSSRQLREALERNGFRVEIVRPYNALGFFGWLIVCKLLKKSTSNVQGRLANFLFSLTLPLERQFFSPFGLSVVAKARKAS